MNNNDIIGLDIGTKRIGVARVNLIARIPQPLPIIDNNINVSESIKLLIKKYQPLYLVIGLPRNLNGEETKQSIFTKEFVDSYIPKDAKVKWQDETLTSKEASSRTGKIKDLDSDAACLILEDYLLENYVVS